MQTITTVGLDVAKPAFQLHGMLLARWSSAVS